MDSQEYQVGTQHIIWINPSMCDTLAEVVAYDKNGIPLVRVLDGENDITLEPHEFVFPSDDDRKAVETLERLFTEVNDEEL